ncbi:hypothetical protein G7K_0381-t1 [Saitoella complicata NRRL Y-17804]|uniref:Uncharacterized protein n=1 Tax=Saitoella complicata (strain BCRC 22490 / CBS 7301 / JCM 7358 / NBRC 10748 / NRRL Y-17804) TaxID=698492 RepID=A0A0E9N8A7_SAICN|nr:hypothetical protein G7K_0381-t1 [Saitoella complicata NRRL Y-17804]
MADKDLGTSNQMATTAEMNMHVTSNATQAGPMDPCSCGAEHDACECRPEKCSCGVHKQSCALSAYAHCTCGGVLKGCTCGPGQCDCGAHKDFCPSSGKNDK